MYVGSVLILHLVTHYQASILRQQVKLGSPLLLRFALIERSFLKAS